MNYYRISMRKTLNPERPKFFHQYDWRWAVVRCRNYGEARLAGQEAAKITGEHFCCAIRLPAPRARPSSTLRPTSARGPHEDRH